MGELENNNYARTLLISPIVLLVLKSLFYPRQSLMEPTRTQNTIHQILRFVYMYHKLHDIVYNTENSQLLLQTRFDWSIITCIQ